MASPRSNMRTAARMIHAHDDAALKMEFEYLHRRDEDLSVKSGAVLGFSGLLIAATLVLLAAEPGTVLHVPGERIAIIIAAIGLALLFVGSAFSLLAIASARVYEAADAEALLERFDRRLATRDVLWRAACLFTLAGAVGAGVAYGLALAANVTWPAAGG